MSDAPAPLCTKCRWHYLTGTLALHMCGRATKPVGTPSPVTGKQEYSYVGCEDERKRARLFSQRRKRCGPSGQFWESAK